MSTVTITYSGPIDYRYLDKRSKQEVIQKYLDLQRYACRLEDEIKRFELRDLARTLGLEP